MANSLALHKNSLPLLCSVGSLEEYIAQISKTPMLTAEEEYELALRFRDKDDVDAAGLLVMSHLRFVVKIAKGYSGYGLNIEDLIQEGNVGLMKAVKRFNPDMQVRLVSFAVHWIKAEMHEFIVRNWKIAKVATTKAQRKLFFNLRKSKKRLGWFTQKEVEALADNLGVKPSSVIEMENRLNNQDVCFDEPDGDDENSFSPSTFLHQEQSDPATTTEGNDWASKHQKQMFEAIKDLDDRSRDIVEQRWLREKKLTLSALSVKYNVSIERIRQIESCAFKKLKSAICDAL